MLGLGDSIRIGLGLALGVWIGIALGVWIGLGRGLGESFKPAVAVCQWYDRNL